MILSEQDQILERIQQQSERWGCYTIAQLVDKLDEQFNEIERLRTALELIAGTASDKLQALQAKNALDQI